MNDKVQTDHIDRLPTITEKDLGSNLDGVLERVFSGETLLIKRGTQPMAVMVPTRFVHRMRK